MFEFILNVASWGGRDRLAGGAYLVAGTLALVTLPDAVAPVHAQAESGCPEGYYDCHGSCIPNNEMCCEDGTHGSGTYCCCCSSSEDQPRTFMCDPTLSVE